MRVRNRFRAVAIVSANGVVSVDEKGGALLYFHMHETTGGGYDASQWLQVFICMWILF